MVLQNLQNLISCQTVWNPRCNICSTKKNSSVLFDLVSRKSPTYYWQHVNTEKHQRGLRQQDQQEQDNIGNQHDQHGYGSEDGQSPNIQLPKMACQGFNVPGSGGRLAKAKESLLKYLSFAAKNRSHDYIVNVTLGTATLRHQRCTKVAVAPVCKECMALGKDRSILRNIGRFRCKMFAAQLLKARLFQTEKVVEALLEEMKCIDIYELEKEEPQLRDNIINISITVYRLQWL